VATSGPVVNRETMDDGSVSQSAGCSLLTALAMSLYLTSNALQSASGARTAMWTSWEWDPVNARYRSTATDILHSTSAPERERTPLFMQLLGTWSSAVA
jgi:hypothetical protein